MDTAVRQGSLERDAGVLDSDVAAHRQAQFEAAVGLVEEWLRRLPEDDSQRRHLAQMRSVIGALAKGCDHSVAAMSTVRAMLCVNCRRLDAAQGKCFGKPLDQCMFLNG